ncbi:tail fiber domain-containing protein [Brevundimonas diminuta]|uniref:tail fiber domain-containing protein n=1 Tax=Brevundimonas diminuta TaxID=293 RepID=UPI001F5AD841|nr:tail fiber domain-containing protein [Brevundimonas diminuta]
MSVTNSALAQQIADLIQSTEARDAKLRGWIGGSAIGGPNNDGRYPLSDALGQEHLLPSPARLTDMVTGPAAAAAVARDQALAAKSAVDLAANQTENNRALSQAARGAAIDARNLAQEHRNHAGTHEANARYWAELAQSKGESTSEDRAIVEQLAGEVVIHAGEVAQDASDAAASAALAATFDPALYDKKSDTVSASRLTGVIDIARIPVLPSQLQFVSSGGLANLTPAQQNDIGRGSIVTTTDGFRYVYSGSGSKTVASSYTVLADITPAWDSVSDKPSFYPSNIASVAGLQSALDGLAPKSNASFSTAISVNGEVGAHSYAFNTGLLYPDGNHTVIKTGAAGAERYWRFDADGTLYGLNGNIYSNYNMQAMGSLIVGASTAANRVNVEKGWLELRNEGYGPYVDFSTDATTDFHARVSVPKTDGRLWLSHGGGGSVIVGPTIEANSNNGSQAGSVITHAGTEQVMAKQLTFPSVMNPQDNGANALLEVRGAGGGYGAWMKFHRPGAWGTYFGMFENGRWGWGGWSDGAVINEFWTTKNFDPLTRMERYNDGWIQTRDANDRFYFASNGRSYYKSQDGHEWRNNADVWTVQINNGGRMFVREDIEAGNRLQLRGANPTIVLRDTDNRSGMIHVNANRFYVLRGSGTDSEGWASTGGGWPLEIDLENNNTTFGANIYSGIDHWFRVRGSGNGIYWENHGGGWFMVDASWMRAYQDKNIVTGGQVQMGSFTVTSDRRLKTDITPIPLSQASQIIDDTRVYEFTKSGRRMFGMIAQEAREVAPILVSEGADIHEDGDAILSLDQTGYIPILIAEVQALRQRIAQLEEVR